MAISRQKEARSRDYALLLFRMTSRVLYSAQYHRQHCTLHAFEQFGALYMHNHDDKYPPRPGFEPGTPRLQAPVDKNKPSLPKLVKSYSLLVCGNYHNNVSVINTICRLFSLSLGHSMSNQPMVKKLVSQKSTKL